VKFPCDNFDFQVFIYHCLDAAELTNDVASHGNAIPALRAPVCFPMPLSESRLSSVFFRRV
jgi:hypothetical protein